MTMATTIQKLSIATVGASVLAIGAHASPAEAARIFGFETNYGGTPITGSFTIDDAQAAEPSLFPFIGSYPDAIPQADVEVANQSFQFTDVDFYIGNDLVSSLIPVAVALGVLDQNTAQALQNILPTDFDAIAFYNGSSNSSPFNNALAAVWFPASLFSSTSLTAALDALDGAIGKAIAVDFATGEFTNQAYDVRFFEQKVATSVPEPVSIITFFGIGALGAGAIYKRKQATM
jgi:hypothetical protein